MCDRNALERREPAPFHGSTAVGNTGGPTTGAANEPTMASDESARAAEEPTTGASAW